MAKPAIENVSDTALLVAMYRAVESARDDALFRDPLAAKLAGERGERIAARMRRLSRLGSWSVAVRTVIIDELIARAITGGVDTVLNLGAGLDARPYRMALPETLRWIEIDYPRMVASKEERLASERPHCKVERRKMDLADVDARRRLLEEVDAQSKNVLVLTEGVLPYLSVEAVGVLADDLRRMNAVRGWIVDYFSRETLRYRKIFARDFRNAPFKFNPRDWIGFFAQHGWRPKEEHFLVQEGAQRGRPIPLPAVMRTIVKARGLFMSRARREGFRRFAGYFWMEPV